MQLTDFLSPDRIAIGVDAHSKKRALETLSELIAHDQPGRAGEIFDALLSRERLGGTGIGSGVAIPHGRLKDADHTTGALVRLREGVDFDAIDEQPVDLLFALVVPEEATEDHLRILAMLASLFQDPEFRARLRACQAPDDVYHLLQQWQPAA